MSSRHVALPVLGALAVLGMGCAAKDKGNQYLTLPPREAYRQGRDLLERRKLPAALETLQSIDFQLAGGERVELEPLVKLGVADVTFYKGTNVDLIEARSLYQDFVTLFTDHPLAPYALFQAGVCSLEQASHPSKDQSQTRAGFEDLRRVARQYPDSRYAGAAKEMIGRAENQLAEHEFIVGRFYLKRKKYPAAAERFRLVLNGYPAYPEPEKVYYYLGVALLRGGNDAEGRVHLDKVVHSYPAGEYARPAKKLLDESGPRTSVELERAGR